MIATGMPATLLPPIVVTIPGMPGVGWPSDSKSARPLAALSIASVGMNECGIRPLT
jgi:hypothetical protein